MALLVRTAHKRGVRLILCGLAHQPLEMAQRSGLQQRVGAENLFPTLAEGVRAATEARETAARE